MSRSDRAGTLTKALIVAGVCAAISFWAGNEYTTIGFGALVVGFGALIVAAYCVLGWIFTGLGRLIEDRRYRIEAKANAERHAKLAASRECHRANRATWLRTARDAIARQPPAWEKSGDRAAFVWLHARMGKTVTIRKRSEEMRRRYQYGERNATEWEEQEPTEWSSSQWVVNLPDDALTPVEHNDRVDESVVTVCWKVPGATTLPVNRGSVSVNARGIEIRCPPRSWSEVNDYDHGYFGTYVEVVRIEDPR